MSKGNVAIPTVPEVVLPKLIHMLSHQFRKRSQWVDQVIHLISDQARIRKIGMATVIVLFLH